MFRGAERVGLQELGPRLTLKLRSLQRGTFNSKHGEFLWLHKVSPTSHCPPYILNYCAFIIVSEKTDGHKQKKISPMMTLFTSCLCKNGAKTFQLSFFCLSVIRGYEMLIGRPVFSYTIGSSVCLSVAVVLVALTTVVSMATPEVGASRG